MPAANVETRDAIALDDLMTIDELASQHPHFSVSAMRWVLRRRAENGLNSACVKFGKKLLVSRTRFAQWLATQAGVA